MNYLTRQDTAPQSAPLRGEALESEHLAAPAVWRRWSRRVR